MDIVIVIIAMYVLNKITLKVINKEKDIVVKVLYGVCLIISDIFLIIYYTDRFNIPTFF